MCTFFLSQCLEVMPDKVHQANHGAPGGRQWRWGAWPARARPVVCHSCP